MEMNTYIKKVTSSLGKMSGLLINKAKTKGKRGVIYRIEIVRVNSWCLT